MRSALSRLAGPSRFWKFPQASEPCAAVHIRGPDNRAGLSGRQAGAMTCSPTARAFRRTLSGLLAAICLLTPTPPLHAVASATSRPGWDWPLQPRPVVVRGFDPPSDPWGAGHRGVDLAASPGDPVLAVAAGRVSFAGQVAGTGVVVVRHGGLRSTYQPVTPAVARGKPVTAGTTLGTLSTVGSHCLPAACLHLGARRGEEYVDPLSLLGDLPVRLKPLDGMPAPPVRLLAPVAAYSGALGARVGLTVGRP